jgi:hypothetical protein
LTGGAQRIPISSKAAPITAGTQRSALGEVTINHRKVGVLGISELDTIIK